MVRYLLFYFILHNCAIFYSSSEEYPGGEELSNKPASHTSPYSEHENPPEPPTKLADFHARYKPRPSTFISNALPDFTPTRLYAQVRHRDIVKRVPREQVANEAGADEEQENMNRLRAVIKKQKINTYYTEEGYEDAAYDHAGHIRDADFDEKYNADVLKQKGSQESEDKSTNNPQSEVKKADDDGDAFEGSVEFSSKPGASFPRYGFFRTWEESGNHPRKFTESETWKLERDLMKKHREAADDAETEVPESLRYLTDDSADDTSDDDEYNTIPSTLDDDDSEENDISDSREFEKKSESSFRIVAAPANSTLTWFESNKTTPDRSVDDSRTLLASTTEVVSGSTPPTSHFPSLSQVYETWKRRGVEEKYEESSEGREGEHNLVSKEVSSEERADKAPGELETTKRFNKKYVVLVRKPTVPCNDSKPKDVKNKENSWSDQRLTMLQPPPLSQPRQVTYADFLPKNHGNPVKSSVAYKSGPMDTSIEGNSLPPSIFVYHYHRQPHYRHQPTWKDLKNYILPSTAMTPPARTSRSEYAHYNTEKRNGDSKPQYHFRPEVLKSRLVFRIGGKTPEKTQKYAADGKKRNYEKVPLRGVKNSYQSVNERQFIGLRQKRSAEELNEAPKIVEEVVGKEIDMRFPSDEAKGNHQEEEEDLPIREAEDDDEIENVSDDEKKVEVEIPEFKFSEVNPPIKIYEKKKMKGPLNHKKYPFYYNNAIPRSSPMKYATNPRQIPRKTLGGSEFYDSRDRYLQCEEIDADLSRVVPEKEEPTPGEGPEVDLPRLRGLGDKIACHRAKYFDENPLDNPLFSEREVESPSIPEELNPFSFMDRISHLSSDAGANVQRRVSKRPEIIDIRPLESRKNEIIDPNHKWSQPEQSATWSNHARKHRHRSQATTAFPFVPYENLVYENVMDTIKNLTHLYKQYPSTLKSRVKVSSKLKKAPTPTVVSHSQRKKKVKNHFIYITTQAPDVLDDVAAPERDRHRKFKIIPYRTNKVTYRTRRITRPIRGVSNKTVDYLKTVRVHKRQVDPSDLDLQESKTMLVGNSTIRRRHRKPENSTQSNPVSVAAKRIAYTIIDRAKNFDSQKSNKHGDFTTESTSTARNEPKYAAIRRFDGDVDKTANNSSDLKQINERYDVYEEDQEEQAKDPAAIKQGSKNSSDDVESNDSEQFSGSTFDDDDDDESRSGDDKSGSYEQKKDSGEQHDESDDDRSNVDEADDSGYQYNNRNGFFTMSDHEKDFERYSSRPLSPYQSFNDPKYADLGPRISKPAFYHPPFESIGAKKNNEDESGSGEEQENRRELPKFRVPWYEDENASGEMKNRREARRGYEFPWERRARLRAMRKEIDRQLDEEYYPLESMTTFTRVFPWESSSKSSKFGDDFWKDDDDFDSHSMSSDVRPAEHDHHRDARLKSSRVSEEVEEALGKFDEEKQNDATHSVTTVKTTILQIPATSAELLTEAKKSTTPTSMLTTPREVHTLRSRGRGGVRKTGVSARDQARAESKPTTTATPRISTKTTPRKRKLPNSNNDHGNNYGQRFRVVSSSTTSEPFHEKLSNYSVDGRSTAPTKRKIEHRSKVSKEKIITKTTFPLMKRTRGDGNDDNNDHGGAKINKRVQKLSIVTNEDPEHIFQTKEIEENGKKNLFITIIPNNRSQVSAKTNRLLNDTMVEQIDVKNVDDSESEHQESREIDESIPLNDKLQLTEHNSKKMMSSISWASENYDE